MIVNTPEQEQSVREAATFLKWVMEEVIYNMQLSVGDTTQEIDDHIRFLVETSNGHKSAPEHFYDFPSFSCLSINDEAAHGIASDRRIQADDILKIDISILHKNGYCADMCRTVYFGNDDNIKNMVEAGPEAIQIIEDTVNVNDSVMKIGKIIEDIATDRGIFVIDSLYGHGIGTSLHEEPNIPNVFNMHDIMTAPKLRDGELFCVEPMFVETPTRIYAKNEVLMNGTGAKSTHYEDMILLTSSGSENLTAF